MSDNKKVSGANENNISKSKKSYEELSNMLKSLNTINDNINYSTDINKFNNQGCVAKYAGLTWRKKQSGGFTAENTFLTKTGNKYLRYYLLEAAGSILRYNSEYNAYYHKKYDEALIHKHKRALALTGRKLVRLIFSLLRNNQLYTSNEVVNKVTI